MGTPTSISSFWMIRMGLLIGVAFIYTPADSAIREYEPEQPVEIDPIETPFTWITAANWQSDFRRGTDPPKYFGTTLAGQAEFSWVVDIRNLRDRKPENWATGNLISDLWAMTACSIVKDWEKIKNQGGFIKSGTWIVSFFTNYVWEDYIRYNAENEKVYHLYHGHDGTGTRMVETVVKHPKCDVLTRLNNFMLVKVNHRIPIYIPVIGYMPIYKAPESVAGPVITFKDSVFRSLQGMDGTHGYRKLLCYVASVGRPYFNIDRPANEDFKVKYRVYYSDFDYCTDNTQGMWQALCINNGNNPRSSSDKNVVNQKCVDAIKNEANSGERGQFMCFRTYARHGAVCDHDRGAPLVCEGEVYGFVVRGVPPEYCVNTRMFPFIVVKIDALQGNHIYAQPPASPYFDDPRIY